VTLQIKVGFSALIDLVQAIPNIQGTVNRGVPESFPSLVSAYVAVGTPTVEREGFGGAVRVDALYYVGFGYAIEGAEETAEDELADTLDAFIRAIEADPSVGGVFAEIRYGPEGPADYATVVGQEFRHVRFAVEGQQRETIAQT
jgi:hypothetical protein